MVRRNREDLENVGPIHRRVAPRSGSKIVPKSEEKRPKIDVQKLFYVPRQKLNFMSRKSIFN